MTERKIVVEESTNVRRMKGGISIFYPGSGGHCIFE